jgi:hypothetical protein
MLWVALLPSSFLPSFFLSSDVSGVTKVVRSSDVSGVTNVVSPAHEPFLVVQKPVLPVRGTTR